MQPEVLNYAEREEFDMGRLVAIYLQALTWLSIASMIAAPILWGSVRLDFSPIFLFWAASALKRRSRTARRWVLAISGLGLLATMAVICLVIVQGTAGWTINLGFRKIQNPELWQFLLIALPGMVVEGFPFFVLITPRAARQFAVDAINQSIMPNAVAAMRFEPADESRLLQTDAMVKACIIHMRSLGIDQWDDVYPSPNDFRRDLDAGTLFVLKDDNNELAGCATLDTNQPAEYGAVAWSFPDAPIGVVHRLMISPRYMGRGVAKKLMGLIEQKATSLGYRTIRLDAFLKNRAAMKLYQSLGYRRAGQVTFRKGEFACFEKRLENT